MKNKIYKISNVGLKNAQARLNKRVLFKSTPENYKEYENFVIKTYGKGLSWYCSEHMEKIGYIK